MIEIQPYRWNDWATVAPSWHVLAAQSASSFFLSPAWVETWLEVFGEQLNPRLLTFVDAGEVVGACLLVRRLHWRKFVPMRRVHLNCAGENHADGTCVEYNRLLCLPGRDAEVSAALLAWIGRTTWDELALDGMEAVPALIEGCRVESKSRPSYYVDLSALRSSGMSYDTVLSANTRQQIRRSIRLYEESTGPLVVEQPRDKGNALEFLDELAELHQKSWSDRGKPGVFASHRFHRFHIRLIERTFAAGSIQLVRVRSGSRVVGLLHCFVHQGRLYFYQSGLASESDKHAKPGLMTHFLAINHYLAERPDVEQYDLLAGDSQYKRSLARERRTLDWLVAQRPTLRVRAFWLLRVGKRRMSTPPLAEA